MTSRNLIAGICILVAYFGGYTYFYAGRVPAANLAYFVYLKGGVETGRAEWLLYYFYYPIYEAHKCIGGNHHNFDRRVVDIPKDFNG